ncbi:MAG: HYR domain-containing protein [Saprospiraceae bacterium]|nr:HYR domain-containing protein [Saprospiraceae bacterium]
MNRFLFFCLWAFALPAAARPMLADTIPPLIDCPPSVVLNLPAGVCDTQYTYSVTATDEAPGVVLAQGLGLASGSAFPVGVTTNLFVAVDAAGNTASCLFSVQVIAGPGPALFCMDLLELQADATCEAVLQPAMILEGVLGCANGYLAEVDKTAPFGNGPWLPAEFGAADLGKTYQVRITDPVSLNRCWGNVRLVDSLPPQLICSELNLPCALPSDHLTPSFLADSLGLVHGRPAVLNNCPPATIDLAFVDMFVNLPCDTPGNVTGYIRRLWTGTDAAGNKGTCLQTINRVRSLNAIFYPPDITLDCANPNVSPTQTGGPYVQVSTRKYNLLTAPFCEIDPFYDDSIETTCGGGWRIRRVWDITDACRPIGPGNPVSGIQYIEIKDSGLPVLQCPGSESYQVLPQNCSVSIDLPDVLIVDNCSELDHIEAFWTGKGGLQKITSGILSDFFGNNLLHPDTMGVFGTVADFPFGVTKVLYVATDACGNAGTCEFEVDVWDSLAPVARCDSFLTVLLDAQGQYVLPAELADNGSSDSCSALDFKIRRVNIGPCEPDGRNWDDNLVFCCADAGDTLGLLLRAYDIALPPGQISATYGEGQFSECSLSVVVLDTLGPQCLLAPMVEVPCTGLDALLATVDDLGTSCQVDSLAVLAPDLSQLDSACREGTVIRRFQVFDNSTGKNGSCSQAVVVTNLQDYYVRFPDDVILTVCNADGLYGEPQFFELGCENLEATFTDKLFTVVPDACYKIERTWTIRNLCQYDSSAAYVQVPNPAPQVITGHPANLVGPVVSPAGTAAPWAPTVVKLLPTKPPQQVTDFSQFWAPDAKGYQYTQIIKVIDITRPDITSCPSTAPSVTDETPNDTLLWNETYWINPVTQEPDLCEGAIDLCIEATDLCAGANLRVRFELFLDLDGNNTQETVLRSDFLPGYNNVQFNNFNTPNYGGGTPRKFDERPVPADQKYGFALQTTASGNTLSACVRWNTQANPEAYVPVQLPPGTHKIKWLVEDGCGNERVCTYFFDILSSGVCSGQVMLGGNIQTETGAGVADVTVQVDLNQVGAPTPQQLSVNTNDQGLYHFQAGTKDSYQVTPGRDGDDINGVSTLDMLLINKHILGLEPLNSPYKLIAADANNSRSVTTFDIVELRKLILGLNSSFPNNTSWRFVTKDFVFPNPTDPFQAVFPEIHSGANPSPLDPPELDFTAVKIGDVNGSAVPSVTGPSTDTRGGSTAWFDLADREYQAGEEFNVALQASTALPGYQFTLAFPDLELLDLTPGPGLRSEHFAAFPAEHVLTSSWFGEGIPRFTLRFRATTPGRLSEQLRFWDQPTRAEAYSPALEPQALALRFDGQQAPARPFELFPNQPNPFQHSTSIEFYLPEAKTATLRVMDASGRELFRQSAHYEAGLHRLALRPGDWFAGTGILYYQLSTDTHHAIRKMNIY